MRQGGIVVGSLNIGRDLRRRGHNIGVCTCGARSNEASVPLKEKWCRLQVGDLPHYHIGGAKPGSLANLSQDTSKRNFLIDASRCEEALVYVFGIIDVNKVIVAQECLECAHRHYAEHGFGQGVAIIIPHDNGIRADTEDDQQRRKRKIEDSLRAAEEKETRFIRQLRDTAGSASSGIVEKPEESDGSEDEQESAVHELRCTRRRAVRQVSTRNGLRPSTCCLRLKAPEPDHKGAGGYPNTSSCSICWQDIPASIVILLTGTENLPETRSRLMD
ncbi:hypothetical protein J7T55_011032 [Diaporthe amygdali]|uniref:uncharacterized protein n=1 Tax=Phomopsis amygdali TaxID=1214568 RepID=UPI0022FE300F|nr:uncharacterized protein J7T55_011032 [Diaporthe amygdali]KAJ0106937.1 hypothetical protein J7T55_011032 [Diaporthe amygdali]